MKIAGITISSPDKIIYPKLKITKLEMVKYYEQIAEKMLPYLKDRPLTLQRFPDGISKDGFYQKNASDYFPSFIRTVKIATEEGSNTQVICNSKIPDIPSKPRNAELSYLARQKRQAQQTR